MTPTHYDTQLDQIEAESCETRWRRWGGWRLVKLGWVALLLGLVVLAVLGPHDTDAPRAPMAPSTEARADIGVESRRLLAETVAECNGSWYATADTWPDGGTLHQYAKVAVTVEPWTLAEADRLNGVTWKGRVSIRAEAERSWHDGTWGRWRPAVLALRITVVTLTGNVVDRLYDTGLPEAVDCTAVPR
jgi:hypothetical protein